MTGEERRNKILKKLMESSQPMSGAALARAFQVSRQVIVQDIALMRAEHYDIMSTNKGYLYRNAEADTAFPKRVFYHSSRAFGSCAIVSTVYRCKSEFGDTCTF